MIVQNQVRCKKCGDDPFSAYTHDYKPCKCGAIAVDGGLSYLRRVGDIDGYEEMSIEIDDSMYEDCLNAMKWADDNGRNETGKLLAIFRALRDNGINLNK